TKLELRRSLREQVNKEWAVANQAPCALMVLHHLTRRDAWKRALGSAELHGDGRPGVILLDATTAAAHTNYNAVKRIPDFLQLAREEGLRDVGVVAVTDDPRTFFTLRAQLYELKLGFNTHVWAAEAEEPLLSRKPCPDDWRPEVRSNSNFSVGIVDRDASQVALALQRLAQSAGGEDHPGHRALMAGWLYLLPLSHPPPRSFGLTPT